MEGEKMNITDAYKTVSKHIFIAHKKYSTEAEIIILASSFECATEKAKQYYYCKDVFVKRAPVTHDPQILTT